MLDDLKRGQPAETVVRQSGQVGERVRMLRVQPARPALVDHFRVGIDAHRRDPALAQQLQEFSATAADVQHV